MDESIELALRGLKVIARFIFQVVIEALFEHLLEPLFDLIASLYRCVRDILRRLLHFDVIAIPLAALVVGTVAGVPLFIFGKAVEWLLAG